MKLIIFYIFLSFLRFCADYNLFNYLTKTFRAPYWPQKLKNPHHWASVFFFFYCFSSFFFFITFTLKTPSFALENLFVPYAFSFTGLRIVCGEMTYLCFSVREIRGALESFCYRSFTWIPNFLLLTCCLKRKLQNCLPNDLVREKKWEWRFAESVEVTERERERFWQNE